MIDIQQLTSLISAFRVETENESISPASLARRSKGRQTVGSILQAIADLLATATSETEYNLEKRDGYFDIIYERPTEL